MREANGPDEITFFEITTCAAFLAFARTRRTGRCWRWALAGGWMRPMSSTRRA
jgi:hypothetical protein